MRCRSTYWFSVMSVLLLGAVAQASDALESGFRTPPPETRPGVYWYFMDGNLTREGMTADLEAMKEAGIGNLVFLEVNVGVPRGPVDFLSEEWQELFAHAVREAERLGIEITLGSGPGWAGSGGPWVKLEQSMQHLVAESIDVTGPAKFDAVLPRPAPREPYFGRAPMSPEMLKQWESYYADVSVLAFPTPAAGDKIADIDGKALYYRAPYSSRPGVKPYLPALAEYPEPADAAIDRSQVIDLTDRLQPDGRLEWLVPPGNWTVMRFGRRNTGATTRPAPQPGLGFECDKLDAAAFDAHFDNYVGKLLKKVGPREKGRGWTMLHIDSWEMGSQNWTGAFREEFRNRRGYDLLPFLPTYTGRIVGSLELSERFLWDMRLTAQELVLKNHAGRLKELAHQHGFGLSIEPYDMNPNSDLDLGAVADVPMCEFWSEGYGFDAAYSVLEATSIAHTLGRPIVAAEAFTANSREAWKLFPGAVKNQGDWAFCMGINRFVYHTFAHKPQGRRPGMVMGPYGVHWDRGQTWWPMASTYHEYVSRCQFLLRHGQTVADVLYLVPEGAPHVFRPPPSALEGAGSIRDRKGHNFDACSPMTLISKASVRDGQVVFPGGAAYRLLVLPAFDTMTPALLAKIKELGEAGATIVGSPPRKSPSLVDYPDCDQEVAAMAAEIWGEVRPPADVRSRRVGKGRVVWGGDLVVTPPGKSEPPAIEQAQWIWYAEGNPAASAPTSTRYFLRRFSISAERRVRSASLEMTADNSCNAWVNGKQAGQASSFHVVTATDVTDLLKPGQNMLAVEAANGGDSANPAGLIACLHIEYADGSELNLTTDDQWQVARVAAEDWRVTTATTDGWVAAKDLGPVGMDPWRLKPAPETCPELYPHYDATARLLAEMNVPPDFETDGPIRYTHRRDEGLDLYFVASRKAEAVETTCTFRVAGMQPELWDPLTGTSRRLPEFTKNAGRTTVPMRFEPHQSFFVLFRDGESVVGEKTADAENFPRSERIGELDGAWQVSFDPKLGGPGDVTFADLDDWSQRTEPGIKHFSGIATYRKSFDVPSDAAMGNQRMLLDLGVVHNMARVRLNGHDLGVVWCAPWQVDVTDAIRAKGNRLEIEVANLWPNRLIGDQALPEEQRVSWTTLKAYRADSPLLPSGLLGPVTVMTNRKTSPVNVTRLRCSERVEPVGVDDPTPTFAWQLQSDRRGVLQTAYQVLVASSAELLELGKADLWDSGRVESEQSRNVEYRGKPLRSSLRCFWTVRVLDEQGEECGRCKPATFVTGLLVEQDWQANWITMDRTDEDPLPMFRKVFPLTKPVAHAVMHVCGLGQYEMSINGQRIGDREMDPGWTNYRKTCLYSSDDVTGTLQRGENVIGVMLGNGMYNVPGGRYVKFTGSFGPPKLICQMQVTYADGTVEIVSSDKTWKCSPSPIAFSCIYGGEDYDARREQGGWNAPGFDDKQWSAAVVCDGPGGRLVAQSAPPITVADTLHAAKIVRLDDGRYEVDCGVNLSARPFIRVKGKAGDQVTITCAEKRGEPWPGHSYTYTLRGAKGNDGEVFCPKFTFFSFQYLYVSGVERPEEATGDSGLPLLLDGGSEFLTSSASSVGSFRCSNGLINDIDAMIARSVRSNLQSVLTDCPHREKLGWLEVAHLMGPSILYHYDAQGLYRKICRDTTESQLESGMVPDIAPEYTRFTNGFFESAEWGSASVQLPWLLYRWYGDHDVLDQQYETMARYVHYLADTRNDEGLAKPGLGDWYDWTLEKGHVGPAQLTPPELPATVFLYDNARIMARVAKLTGRDADVVAYERLADQVRRDFLAAYYDSDSKSVSAGSQAALATALYFGLVPETDREAVMANLVAELERSGYRQSTGEVCFRMLVQTLAEAGRSDLVFRMLNRADPPGYGHMLGLGFKTLSERWDRPGSSMNHCMFGHAQEWFQKSIVGIQQAPDSVGFKHVVLRPEPVGDLSSASGHFDGPYGRIESRWKIEDGQFEWHVAVPPNTTAEVHVPAANGERVLESGRPAAKTEGVTFLRMAGGTGNSPGIPRAVFAVGSGKYLFRSQMGQ